MQSFTHDVETWENDWVESCISYINWLTKGPHPNRHSPSELYTRPSFQVCQSHDSTLLWHYRAVNKLAAQNHLRLWSLKWGPGTSSRSPLFKPGKQIKGRENILQVSPQIYKVAHLKSYTLQNISYIKARIYKLSNLFFSEQVCHLSFFQYLWKFWIVNSTECVYMLR